ncbi:MAG: response regulator, partial [Cyanobacteria bacterium J06606_4]
MKNTLRVLVIDDDEVDRMALQRALKKTSFNAVFSEAVDASGALELMDGQKYDFIFLDYNLPGKNGLKLTLDIRSRGVQIPIIVLTGQGDEQTAVELMKAGASDYLPKNKLAPSVIARQMRSAIKVYKAEMLAEEVDRELREKNLILEKKNKELERQRQYIYRQNLRLQEVSRLKSEFLAMMSHELRTPLNAIIGFSQILLRKSKGPLAKSQRNMLDRILANGQNLLDLINDILTLSKIEAGRLDIEPTQMDLAQFIQQTTEELRSLATQKSLALKVDVELTNTSIKNDPIRLRQILVNLLS